MNFRIYKTIWYKKIVFTSVRNLFHFAVLGNKFLYSGWPLTISKKETVDEKKRDTEAAASGKVDTEVVRRKKGIMIRNR